MKSTRQVVHFLHSFLNFFHTNGSRNQNWRGCGAYDKWARRSWVSKFQSI